MVQVPMLPGTLVLGVLASGFGHDDPDGDRDGLSDFQETHKYGTNPRTADSDGDGVPDGDWVERREYAYVVRSVVQVMKPVTPEFLNDDYQDARVLDEGEDFVELEVIHYPFNTVHTTLAGDPGWRDPDPALAGWLAPGPTSDWSPALARELRDALKEEGIDVLELDDRAVVEQASRWLVDHAGSKDGFSTFLTSFDELGRPYVTDLLRSRAEREAARSGLSLDEMWEREISAAGMFRNAARGSCTSSSIYLSGCLRALGVPTRTILCIPIVDASDQREMRMVESGIAHNEVRRIILAALRPATGSWTSHTFNEVFVGSRWRRLNYSRLGQNILDSQCLGLMTHVATFHDWADARMPETVGLRQESGRRDDRFGGTNPYSTISLRDVFGPHCMVENPPPEEIHLTAERLPWTDSPELPDDIREGCRKSGRFGLIALIPDAGSTDRLRTFLAEADVSVRLEASSRPALASSLQAGCWWWKNGLAYVYVPLAADGPTAPARGTTYTARAGNATDGYRLEVDLEVRRD